MTMLFIVDDSKALRGRLVKMLSEMEGVEVVGQAHPRILPEPTEAF